MTFNELYPRPSPRERLIKAALDGFDFRLATPEDVPELGALFEVFFEEAGYKDRGIVYSRPRSETWLEHVISLGRVPHIVALQDGKIVGVCSYDLDGTFCVEPVAVMHTIFVVKEHRHSALGRVLIGLATDMAKGDGACAFHAPIASGMVEQASLVNLFAKGGFGPIGVILGRSL
jgi:L-amino acid N-acyltransferase YncA